MLMLNILATLCVAAPQEPLAPAVASAEFAAPIRLTADGEPLAKQITYPSPRLLDIDLDGTLELVVGDLPGNVYVAEKTGEGLQEWTSLSAFKTDGRALKFHNW